MSKPRQRKAGSAPRAEEDADWAELYEKRFVLFDKNGDQITPLGVNGDPIMFLDEFGNPTTPFIFNREKPKPSKDTVLLIGRQPEGLLAHSIKLLDDDAKRQYGGKAYEVNSHVKWLLQVAIKTKDSLILNAIAALVGHGLAGGTADQALKHHKSQGDIIIARNIFLHVAQRIVWDGWSPSKAKKEAASLYAPMSMAGKKKGEVQKNLDHKTSLEGASKKVKRIYEDYAVYKKLIPDFLPYTPEEEELITKAEALLKKTKSNG